MSADSVSSAESVVTSIYYHVIIPPPVGEAGFSSAPLRTYVRRPCVCEYVCMYVWQLCTAISPKRAGL